VKIDEKRLNKVIDAALDEFDRSMSGIPGDCRCKYCTKIINKARTQVKRAIRSEVYFQTHEVNK